MGNVIDRDNKIHQVPFLLKLEVIRPLLSDQRNEAPRIPQNLVSSVFRQHFESQRI
jgi:hypothetical protein